ncbi:MAG TPA: serine/threonine-protein kinase [Vicinamibacterales bacterium]|nr:serine/threonine-protein kinase [Vicinamibacterales bacterium]
MIGRTVSHYRILSPLGSGGMGVVYLAEDARLGRQVALKFLPAAWSQESKALERFRVEARAASSLSHPAICAIYDIGQDGDTPFIVMEALKGETLRDRIQRGPLKVPDVVDIGIQLADALEAAHSQGIVHRDIKPANIFIGDRNRVKVLDFGLAKLTGAPSSLSSAADTHSPGNGTKGNQITQPGTALGTVSYMSPEQARGESIDSRTDLFSLGAVLYEMVTGVQAFGGSTTAVVYDAILNRAPRPIAHLNPLIPPRLEGVIATALEKDRDLRHQHASDLQAELRRIRRDIDAQSLGSSQTLVMPTRASAPAVSASATTPPKPEPNWLLRVSIVLAVLALVVAAILFTRGQSASDNRAVAPASEAPAISSAQPAPTPVSPPPTVTTPPPTQEPRTASESPAPSAPPAAAPSTPPPAPQPRPRPVTPPETLPGSRASLPPPPATTPASPGQGGGAAAATPPPPVVTPSPAPPAVATPAPEEVKPQPTPTPAAAAPAPEPVAPPPPAPVQPAPPRAAAAPEPAPTPVAPVPVESDEAAIRRVIGTFERAIETKDIALYRSVRPNLSKAAETVLTNSFRQIDTQEIDLQIENLRVEGRTASARIVRRDTLIISGRRQVQNSTQTLRFEKTATGWIIAE